MRWPFAVIALCHSALIFGDYVQGKETTNMSEHTFSASCCVAECHLCETNT